MGLGLACLEMASTRGWWGGLTALVSLVPIAVALALGGPLAAGLAAAVAILAVGRARGAPAMLIVALKYVLPGAVLGLGLAGRRPIAVTALLTALASLAGLVLLLAILAPPGVGPLTYLDRQIAAHAAELEQWP